MKAYLTAALLFTIWLLAACSDNESRPGPTSAAASQARVESTATVQPKDEPAAPLAAVTLPAEGTTVSENQPAQQDEHDAESTVEEPTPATEVEVPGEPARDIRTFEIVPDRTEASYIVAEEFLGGALDRLGIQPGLVDTVGRTQEVEGTMQLDFNNLAAPVMTSQFSVNLRSLTSDQPRRDNRIREANLESNRYPLAQFTITSLVNTPTTYANGEEVVFQANGNITIREITQPATFEVMARLEDDTITGVATTQLRMTDFGFEPPNFANVFSVEDQFTAKVDFTFKEQP